jgi:hypothetical protein
MALNLGFSKGYAVTMASATGSAVIAVGEGFQRVYLQIATCASVSALDVYGSSDLGTTYYQLRHMAIASASSQTPTFIVASSAMVNGAMVPVPPGFTHYKIKCTDSNPSMSLGLSLLCNT